MSNGYKYNFQSTDNWIDAKLCMPWTGKPATCKKYNMHIKNEFLAQTVTKKN